MRDAIAGISQRVQNVVKATGAAVAASVNVLVIFEIVDWSETQVAAINLAVAPLGWWLAAAVTLGRVSQPDR